MRHYGRRELPARISAQFQAVSVVYQAVQNGIGQRGIGDAAMPLGHGYLRNDQGGGAVVAIVQDVEQVLNPRPRQRVARPVIENQELHPGQGVQEAGIGAIGVGHGRLVEQPGGAVVAHGVVGPAGGVGQGGDQEGLAHTGRPQDQGIEVLTEPFALGQLQDEAAVEAAGGGQVERFDGRRERQAGRLQTTLQAVVVPMGALLLHEQGQALLEGQLGVLGVA